MFFPPQKTNLIVGAVRRKDGVLLFQDAHTPVIFVYGRAECRTMTWAVKSAWRTNSNDAIDSKWWSLADRGTVKDDLPRDDEGSNPVYLPTLTFHGSKFTDSLLSNGKRNQNQRNLYLALLHSGTLQLDVAVNGEVIIPLHVALEYRMMCR